MHNFLVAVLVNATATVDTIDTHLAAPMRHFIPGTIDWFRLGGEFTGAWDPTYHPQADPTNWRACNTCAGTGQAAGQPCPGCGDAVHLGRTPGTVLAHWDDWAPHPGDLVPLTRLLDPGWRFPVSYRRPSTPPHTADRHGAAPQIWATPRQRAWLSTSTRDGAATGEVPNELRHAFQTLLDGGRTPGADGPAAFEPTEWQVAIVAGHATPDEDRVDLPVAGSLVVITDPAWTEDDANPEQLYVVSDDVHAPDYPLVRVGGGCGPTVPGYAITEIDPARITLAPLPDGAPTFRYSQPGRPDGQQP